MVYSPNHDIMVSFPLDSDPEFLKPDQTTLVWQCKGALMWLWTSLKVNKTLYICPVWMWKATYSGLQPQPWREGISFSLDTDPKFTIILTKLCWYNSVLLRMHLYDCRHHWKVLKHCIYVQYWCEKQQCSGLQPQPWHYVASFSLDSDQEFTKSDQTWLV